MQLSHAARAAGAIGVLSLAASASAAFIPVGHFQLNNHPDGNSRPPGYGLILTELYDVTVNNDKFTFDFDHEQSSMELWFDGDSIVIGGRVYGGRDVGDHLADDKYLGVYDVRFEYAVVGMVPGDDDLFSMESAENKGSIMTPLGDTIALGDKGKADGIAFRLGDGNDDNGHRGFDGVSGWGWLDHENRQSPSDWLFTVKVPTPGSVAMMMVAAPFAGMRRRRA